MDPSWDAALSPRATQTKWLHCKMVALVALSPRATQTKWLHYRETPCIKQGCPHSLTPALTRVDVHHTHTQAPSPPPPTTFGAKAGGPSEMSPTEAIKAGTEWLAAWISAHYVGMGKSAADALPGEWWGCLEQAWSAAPV